MDELTPISLLYSGYPLVPVNEGLSIGFICATLFYQFVLRDSPRFVQKHWWYWCLELQDIKVVRSLKQAVSIHCLHKWSFVAIHHIRSWSWLEHADAQNVIRTTYYFLPFFFPFVCPPPGFFSTALITPSPPPALASAPFSALMPPCVFSAAFCLPFLPFGRYEDLSLSGNHRSGSGVLEGS